MKVLWLKFHALKSWQRYLLVTVLSFPLALAIRFVLQRLIPEDLASEAVAVVRQRKESPLSEPLRNILADPDFRDEPTQPHALLGKRAVEFTLQDDRGNDVSLSDLCREGPVVLVFYYGYYCPHCVSQLFGVHEDIALFNELGARVVALSADPAEQTRARFKKYGRFGFPVLSDAGNRVAQAYGVYQPAAEGRPESLVHATFLIGEDGRVFWVNCGEAPFLDNKTLLREIARGRERSY